MTFTKIAVACAVALFALVCYLAVAGFGAAREGVISLVALVVLVGGGNWLSGRGPYGARPTVPGPASPHGAPSEGEGAEAPGDEPRA